MRVSWANLTEYFLHTYRSTLPSEAIEEFLSILRPSAILFPPTSPILRSSNGTAHGFVPYRRPTSCGLSPAMSNEGLGLTLADQSDNASKENELVTYPFRFLGSGHLCMFLPSSFPCVLKYLIFSQILPRHLAASPISRTHTRNPFPRHPSFDGQVSAFISQHSVSNTPSPIPMAMSPAAVPLPLPTPDETDLELA